MATRSLPWTLPPATNHRRGNNDRRQGPKNWIELVGLSALKSRRVSFDNTALDGWTGY